jgi:hypothetical protein
MIGVVERKNVVALLRDASERHDGWLFGVTRVMPGWEAEASNGAVRVAVTGPDAIVALRGVVAAVAEVSR